MDLKATQIFYYNKGVRYFIEDKEVSKDCFIYIMNEFVWNKEIRDYKSKFIKEKVNEFKETRYYNIDTNMKIKIDNYIKNIINGSN